MPRGEEQRRSGELCRGAAAVALLKQPLLYGGAEHPQIDHGLLRQDVFTHRLRLEERGDLREYLYQTGVVGVLARNKQYKYVRRRPASRVVVDPRDAPPHDDRELLLYRATAGVGQRHALPYKRGGALLAPEYLLHDVLLLVEVKRLAERGGKLLERAGLVVGGNVGDGGGDQVLFEIHCHNLFRFLLYTCAASRRKVNIPSVFNPIIL